MELDGGPGRPRVDVVAVVVFLAVAFGAAWLLSAPLWSSGRGVQTPGALYLVAAVMVALSIGVLAVVGILRRGHGTMLATGLRSCWPG